MKNCFTKCPQYKGEKTSELFKPTICCEADLAAREKQLHIDRDQLAPGQACHREQAALSSSRWPAGLGNYTGRCGVASAA